MTWDRTDWLVVLSVVTAMFGLALLVVFGAADEAADCRDKGGHTVSKPTTGFSGSGNVTFGSVSFCVSNDGRILE